MPDSAIATNASAMTLEQLQQRLRKAHARIGLEGRFAFTMDQSGDCYITHWFRPTPHAFEDCKAVGSGSVAECIASLDGYVRAYPKNKEVVVPLWQPSISSVEETV